MVKCARYWPDPATKNLILGDFEVTAEEEIRDGDDIILTRLGVTQVDEEVGANARHVIHMQVKGWGDHSVPDNTSRLLHSIKRVQDLARSKRFLCKCKMEVQNTPLLSSRFSSPSPVLVHCSAGVGRTGTWIAVYRLVISDTKGPLSMMSLIFRSRPSPRPPCSRGRPRPGRWSRTCGRPGPRWSRDGSSTHSYSSASEIFLLRKRNKYKLLALLLNPTALRIWLGFQFPQRKLKVCIYVSHC